MNIRTILALGLLAAVAGFSRADAASSADLKFVGLGAGENYKIKLDSKAMTIAVKQQKFKVTKLPSSHDLTPFTKNPINVYCVELDQPTDTSGTHNYAIVGTSDLRAFKDGKGNKVKRIEGLNKLIRVSETNNTWGSAFKTTNNDYAAAFQLMAWDLMYDFDGTANSVNLGTGRFQLGQSASAGVSTIFQQLKTKVLATSMTSQPKMSWAFSNDCQQDYIYAVPEPGTWLAMGIGAAVLLRRRRK